MGAGSQQMAAFDGPPKALQQGLLTRLDEHYGGGQDQGTGLKQNQKKNSFFEETVKPGFGNFESELIVHGLGGSCNQTFRLSQKPDESAFINRAFDFAADSRPIHFQHQ